MSIQLRETFRALRHRDFRLFLLGQVVSLTGTWMQGLAQSWLVYRLTHSTLLMGTIGFATHFPVLLLGPVAGVVADRVSRRRLVIAAQTVFMIQSLLVAALTLTGRVTVTHILFLAIFWGAANAFEIPARQSLYIHLVGAEDLLNAIALNSMTFNAARVVGPAMGGFFVAAFGEGICFLLNGLSFTGVLASLLIMRTPEPARDNTQERSALQHIREGFAYAWHQRKVRVLLAITALANLAVTPVIVLGPVFADEIFHRGARGLGFLSGAVGFGAVIGTLALARKSGESGMERIVQAGAVSTAAAILLFSVSPSFLLSLAASVGLGFSIFRQLASTNSLIQTTIRDEYRGRIMALYSMTVVGMLPVGNLAAGATAAAIGVRATVFCGALLAALAALWWTYELRRS